jgi:hypothetical protein
MPFPLDDRRVDLRRVVVTVADRLSKTAAGRGLGGWPPASAWRVVVSLA